MQKVMGFLLLALAGTATAQQVDLLVYRVKEEGVAPYISRILVSDAFVRIDEGEDSPYGYTLYNRVSHRIYNVDPEEETVLVLQPPVAQPQPPEGFSMDAVLLRDPGAPPVAGRSPRKLELRAAGRLCRTLQVVEGVMPRAVQGLRELRLALARLQGTPAGDDSVDPCELAEYVYAPARALEYGLPLLDLMEGKQQVLLDFDPAFEVPEEVFQVPESYDRVVPPPLVGH